MWRQEPPTNTRRREKRKRLGKESAETEQRKTKEKGNRRPGGKSDMFLFESPSLAIRTALPTLRKTIEKHRSLQTTSPELPSQLPPHFDSFAFINMLEQKSKLIRKGLHIDDCHQERVATQTILSCFSNWLQSKVLQSRLQRKWQTASRRNGTEMAQSVQQHDYLRNRRLVMLK